MISELVGCSCKDKRRHEHEPVVYGEQAERGTRADLRGQIKKRTRRHVMVASPPWIPPCLSLGSSTSPSVKTTQEEETAEAEDEPSAAEGASL